MADFAYEVVHKYCSTGDEFDSIEDARFAAPRDARIIVWVVPPFGGKKVRHMTLRWTRRHGWSTIKSKRG